MDAGRSKNESIKEHDWARAERQAFIARLPVVQASAVRQTTSVSMIDTTSSDRRSVAFQLRGGFSGRAAWWATFSLLHRLISRSGTSEAAMFQFHRMHQGLTIAMLQYVQDSRALRDAILRDGAASALRSEVERAVTNSDGPKSR